MKKLIEVIIVAIVLMAGLVIESGARAAQQEEPVRVEVGGFNLNAPVVTFLGGRLAAIVTASGVSEEDGWFFSDGGVVSAVAVESGELIWQHFVGQTGGLRASGGFEASPVIDFTSGRLEIVAVTDKILFVLDERGSRVWSIRGDFDNGFRPLPLRVSDERMIIAVGRTRDSRGYLSGTELLAFDVRGAEPVLMNRVSLPFYYASRGAVAYFDAGEPVVIVSGGDGVFRDPAGYVLAVSLSRGILWSHKLGAHVAAAPVAAGDKIYVADYGGEINIFNLPDGGLIEIRQAVNGSIYADPFVDDAGRVAAHGLVSGELAYFSPEGALMPGFPVYTGSTGFERVSMILGNFLIPDNDERGGIHIVNASSGMETGAYSTSPGWATAPVVAGGKLIFGSVESVSEIAYLYLFTFRNY